jgi:hypothetical protein
MLSFVYFSSNMESKRAALVLIFIIKYFLWMNSRSIPLRCHYDAYHSNVYQVVGWLNLDFQVLPCLIELNHLTVQLEYQLQLEITMVMVV